MKIFNMFLTRYRTTNDNFERIAKKYWSQKLDPIGRGKIKHRKTCGSWGLELRPTPICKNVLQPIYTKYVFHNGIFPFFLTLLSQNSTTKEHGFPNAAEEHFLPDMLMLHTLTFLRPSLSFFLPPWIW